MSIDKKKTIQKEKYIALEIVLMMISTLVLPVKH